MTSSGQCDVCGVPTSFYAEGRWLCQVHIGLFQRNPMNEKDVLTDQLCRLSGGAASFGICGGKLTTSTLNTISIPDVRPDVIQRLSEDDGRRPATIDEMRKSRFKPRRRVSR